MKPKTIMLFQNDSYILTKKDIPAFCRFTLKDYVRTKVSLRTKDGLPFISSETPSHLSDVNLKGAKYNEVAWGMYLKALECKCEVARSI